MEREQQKKYGALEALLFYHGEPMDVKKIAKLLEMEEKECQELIYEWGAILFKDQGRGLALLEKGDVVQLVTKKKFQDLGKKLIEEEFREELTPAGLETLSLVAYCSPISRAQVDYVRGVNSSFTLRNLLMRGLIERIQTSEKGNRYHYAPTFDFLKHMGISKVEELPEYEKYKEIMKRFETQSSPETNPQEPQDVNI